MKPPPKRKMYEPWVVEYQAERVRQLEAIIENLHPYLVATIFSKEDKEHKTKILEELYKLMPWVKSKK